MSAPGQVLLLDRARPTAPQTLIDWLGADNAARATAEGEERFLLIATFDTHGEPRYATVVEYLRDIRVLTAWLAGHLDTLERLPRATVLGPIDFTFALDAVDRDYVERMLDEREAAQLLRARVGGCV